MTPWIITLRQLQQHNTAKSVRFVTERSAPSSETYPRRQFQTMLHILECMLAACHKSAGVSYSSVKRYYPDLNLNHIHDCLLCIIDRRLSSVHSVAYMTSRARIQNYLVTVPKTRGACGTRGFGTRGDDCTVMLWETRKIGSTPPLRYLARTQ